MKENSLAMQHPEVLKEWDYEKNIITPTDVASNSQKIVWWKCLRNHSYQRKINDKVLRNFQCPICTNRLIVKGINDLATVHPEILTEWDYERNKNIKPDEISSKTIKKVWWKCQNNHSWFSSVYERVNHDKTGCPFCNGNVVNVGVNDLQTINPSLAKELHPTKNGNITASNLGAHSSKKVWWQCKLGHEFLLPVIKRTNGQNCPYCSNKRALTGYNDLETKCPDLMKEWDYKKNAEIKPQNIVFSSFKIASWVCLSCGNEYKKCIRDRTINKQGCPVCSAKKRVQARMKTILQNGTLADNPDMLKDFDYEANLPKMPKDFSPKSAAAVYWKCHVCNYRWQATILNKSRANSCPVCQNKKIIPGVNDLATTCPELIKEWHPTKNGKLTPQQVSRGSGKKVWWLCPNGHEYQATVLHRNGGYGTCCPKCFKKRQTSFAEQSVYFYVKKFFPDAINGYRDIFLGPMELDIYIPSISKAIEYDGMAWHNSETINKEKRKYELCKKNNIKLIRLKEKESEDDLKTCDQVISTEKMWTSEKLNMVIFMLLQKLFVNTFQKGFYIDVEKDRFEIYKNIQISREESIASKYPLLVKEWDYEKNGTLKPEMVTFGMSMKVWWKCSECGNSFEASISHRCNGTGCPKCGIKKSSKIRMKKVACISLETGKVIQVYDSITEACAALGMKSSANVTSVCKGKRPNAGGYFWKYVE